MNDYCYEAVEKRDRLYEKELFSQKKDIKAKYQKALTPCDRGNPFIECLPYPYLDNEQIIAAYTRHLPYYDANEERGIASSERKAYVDQLRLLRFPLPFHPELEMCFYSALCASYRMRKHCMDNKYGYPCVLRRGEVLLNDWLEGSVASATNEGFALLGCSGAGKSSALEVLLEKYPQTVFHEFEGRRVPQIIYLVVSVKPNRHFAELYKAIGHEIDKALGTNNVYEHEIERKKTLGEKLGKLREWIERFAIGAIIFDEIQLISFESTKESSFETLMVLSNETKVAICVVGTEDAYAKMYTNLRTARRVGTVIQAGTYCNNRNYFDMLLRHLWYYQWFDEHIELTEEIKDIFYESSHGIIDQMVGLYIWVQKEYLKYPKRPKVTAHFIKQVRKMYQEHMDKLVKETPTDLVGGGSKNRGEYPDGLALGQAKQSIAANEIMEQASQIEVDKLRNNVVNNIQNTTDEYGVDMIIQAYQMYVGENKGRKLDERTTTRAVFAMLKNMQNSNRKRSRSKSGNTVPHDKMREEVLGNPRTEK